MHDQSRLPAEAQEGRMLPVVSTMTTGQLECFIRSLQNDFSLRPGMRRTLSIGEAAERFGRTGTTTAIFCPSPLGVCS